ncbi:MADS-box domain-containing protein [Plasmodiophora brassicae]|uniref:MADS-box domain-containing protein n=2 Tax=Plasmodiophora brassicae TaxID=37360 RepID=A0A0G4IL56_PLABS|nr:hypothetical protein PBRA_004543 [Plasmodiophora brassicae]
MGRRKIKIEMIPDAKNRTVTFNKRKVGLLKKAIELSVLCGVDVALVVFGKDTIYKFSSDDLDVLMNRYVSYSGHVQELTKDDLEELEEGKLTAKYDKAKRAREMGVTPNLVPASASTEPPAKRPAMACPDRGMSARFPIVASAGAAQDANRKRSPPAGLQVVLPPFAQPSASDVPDFMQVGALTGGRPFGFDGLETPISLRATLEGGGSSGANRTAMPASAEVIQPWANLYGNGSAGVTPTGASSSSQPKSGMTGGFPAGFALSPITCWMTPSPISASASVTTTSFQSFLHRRGSYGPSSLMAPVPESSEPGVKPASDSQRNADVQPSIDAKPPVQVGPAVDACSSTADQPSPDVKPTTASSDAA